VASGKQSRRRRREAQQMAVPSKRKQATRKPERSRAATRRTPAPPASARRASPRVLLGAAAAIVLVGIAIGVVAVVTRGSGSSAANVPTVGSLVNALPGAKDVQRQFAGIGQNGNALGPPDAPVTLVEYVDVQCPFCREYATQSFPQLVSRYVRTGKLRVETRPIAFIGPDSQKGQRALLAAGRQGKLFNLAELLYYNQGPENTGWLTDDLLTAAAASIPGLRVQQFLDDEGSSAVEDQATAVTEQARADAVDSTPTLFVGKTGGKLQHVELASATDLQSIKAAIERNLG
jgi:protein-disulfide isomerase